MTIKPYVFNNYEKALPKNSRGDYRSAPVESATSDKQLEKSNGIILTVDLSGVKDKADVFERFYTKLGFMKHDGPANWDALGDYLWFFPESSSAFNDLNPVGVQIRVRNLNHIWQFSEKDYGIVCELLVAATDNSRFDDGFRMGIEVIND